ncbi:MAG: LLM class F420-dependent oxidoreductase [Chloroflexi bacterium]|nr:LLM class F420-dependent oxidoreductase [Chloroflexota bacterium]MBV9134179.1 LLM class F420-dependent oxidoreductase [Chloroflexota bacterium]
MQIGVVFPQTEIGADPSGVKAYAQAVQQMGFAHLAAYDHVLGADKSMRPDWRGYSSESLFHEPLVLFGYLAAIAPGLELVPQVIILPQRQTALLAKQAAEVDVLTGGKLRLGVGIGWNAVEYEGLGMDFRNRGRRFEEQIALLRRLWTEPVITYEGRYDRITAAGLNPLPIQQPIPLWIGASAEAALKRAAILADGYFPQRPLEGGWPATVAKIRQWRAEAGRDPKEFGIDARINLGDGNPEDWRKAAEDWRGLGATHLSINTMGAGLQGADAHVDALRRVQAAITV